MDVSAMGPFANVECPQCGKHTRVKREFGSYTLLRRHAIGGMSVVFIAHDNTLDREVAVKILNENYSADARRIAAFEEEARITASVSHPHVVRVFTTGRAFGRFFIAMEFVVGGHFERQIEERGTIPEREVLQLAIQVADGLKAALGAGLIHRDIKPGNILLDGDGRAKIVDFGLALLLGKGGTAHAKEIWATPYYVPPETIEGHAEDFRSDMYAFGATLYHALAGKPPCNEESMSTPILRAAKRKVKPLHNSAPWVTPQTCAVVDRAMAYDPAKRFQSYDELLAHLDAALKHLRAGATVPRGMPAGARRRQSARQHGARLLVAAGSIAIVAVLAGFFWWSTHHRTKPGDKAPPPKIEVANGNGKTGAASDPGAATRIANLYREARGALEAGDYEKARSVFAALRDDGAVQEPTRTWAGVEVVVMSYLDGKSSVARREASAAATHLTNARLDDPSIKRRILPVLDRIGELPVISVTEGDFTTTGAPAAMGWLLAGLKNWEQGALTEAVAFFNAVSTLKLAPQDSWVTVYQKIAADYLADFKILSSPVFEQPPADQAARDQAIAELDVILTKLKTRSRARFNVNAWKLDLQRQARRDSADRTDRTDRSDKSDNTEPPKPLDQPKPPK